MKQQATSRPTSVAFLCVLALILGAVPSDAFRMLKSGGVNNRATSGAQVTCNHAGGFTHWTTHSISWLHNTAGQGAGQKTALENAMATWNNVSGASHTLTYDGTTSAGFITDGFNTMVWGIDSGCTGNCIGLTAVVVQPGQVIVESDILFNSNTNWSFEDVQAVATHELGHSLGIHHSDLAPPTPTSADPTMSPSTLAGATYWRTLHADDIAALQCSQNRYPPGQSLTLTAVARDDGWVRESTETSNVGSTKSSTNATSRAIRAGDASSDREYRGVLSFDTSAIPAGATILSATLRLRRGEVVGSNPFDDSSFGSLRVAVKTGWFSTSEHLTVDDFEAAATVAHAATMTNPVNDLDWSMGTLLAAGLNAIDTSGTTQMRIYFSGGDNDDNSADYLGFYSANHADPDYHPQLVVHYDP